MPVGAREVSAVLVDCLYLWEALLLKWVTWEFENQSKALKPFKLTAFTGFHILTLPAFSFLADISQISEVNTWPAENKAVSHCLP